MALAYLVLITYSPLAAVWLLPVRTNSLLVATAKMRIRLCQAFGTRLGGSGAYSTFNRAYQPSRVNRTGPLIVASREFLGQD